MTDQQKTNVSRRGFLKGAGLTAAGTVLEQAKALTGEIKSGTHEPAAIGPDAVTVRLHVNGHLHATTVEPRDTLATILRDKLGLTGTKVVCDRGACSACTVWIDGTPQLACMTLAVDLGDKKITTIEGLAEGETLHPVQAAFVKHDAMQCGFCTPGMVMACASLLKRNPHPSRPEVAHAISGNLCRCGAYPKIFDAMEDLSKHGSTAGTHAAQLVMLGATQESRWQTIPYWWSRRRSRRSNARTAQRVRPSLPRMQCLTMRRRRPQKRRARPEPPAYCSASRSSV